LAESNDNVCWSRQVRQLINDVPARCTCWWYQLSSASGSIFRTKSRQRTMIIVVLFTIKLDRMQ
jgi:hypothetical protein